MVHDPGPDPIRRKTPGETVEPNRRFRRYRCAIGRDPSHERDPLSMNRLKILPALLILFALLPAPDGRAADNLRNLKPGQPLPDFQFPGPGGTKIAKHSLDGKVGLIIFVAAEQRDSERVSIDAQRLAKQYGSGEVSLLFITADAGHRRYFEKFRQTARIEAPLATDMGRVLYEGLGVSVLPTTVLTDKQGLLTHVVTGREPDYLPLLDLFLRHSLGQIDLKGLEDELKVRSFAAGARDSQPDRVRKIDLGAPMPDWSLTTLQGETLESSALAGQVVVLVYLAAGQRNSEKALEEADQIVSRLGKENLNLVFVTADLGQRDHLATFLQETGIERPLAFDEQRELYGKLGLVVFPTTLVIDRKGSLIHVISTRRTSYSYVLDAYVRHALGSLDDDTLKEQLSAQNIGLASPQSIAARHKAVARLLWDKGLLDGARRELEKGLELDPENVHIRLDLADLHLQNRALTECLAIVDAVLEKDPSHRRALLLRGIALFEGGQLDEAHSVLESALILNPDPVRAYYYLGRVHEQRGELKEAIEQYREALQRTLSR